MQTEWAGAQQTADLILQYATPNGSEAGVSSSWQECLKRVPDKLKEKVKHTAIADMIQALAMVKSHYPGVDLNLFEEGYTADVDEAKLLTLIMEAEPIAESLVELIELDDL